MFFGAYLAAALVVMLMMFSASGSLPLLGEPSEWPMALFLAFPVGLAWFFNVPVFVPHVVYVALSVQIIVPSRRVFFSLFGISVVLLCFNVAGCVKGFHL